MSWSQPDSQPYRTQDTPNFNNGGLEDLWLLRYASYDYLDTWFVMEKLVEKGLCRAIGLSNFNSEQITRVLEKAKIMPVTNQVSIHCYQRSNLPPYLLNGRLTDLQIDRQTDI